MKKLTIKDIALHFKVSASTVSKAINDSYEISEKLKGKIQAYAKENNYKPNKVALSLLNKSTKTIGVVLPNILSYFFAQVCFGIERVADEKGYSLITCISDESYKKEVKTLEFLSAGTVDGLIISMTEETQHKNNIDHFRDIMDNNIPMVLFDRVLDSISCDKVIVDDMEAAFEATQHLLKIGCKTIAVLSPLDDSSVGKLRLKGYQNALKDHRIAFEETLVLRLKNEESLEDNLNELLQNKKIDGVLALDELTAVKALKVLKMNKLRVPEDVSVIGFSNGRLSRYASPTLTSISQHGKLIGETAAKLLIQKIEKKVAVEVHTTKIIKTDLILRESTKLKSQ